MPRTENMGDRQTAHSEPYPTTLWEGHSYAHMRTGGGRHVSAAHGSKAWDDFLSWDLDGDLMLFVSRTLFDLELPIVAEGFAAIGRGAWKEFLALDARLEREMGSNVFREASHRTGAQRLEMLAPLKDHRMLTRYRLAVESDEAVGWHPLVYALFLDAYSIPLREGLSHYGSQALGCLVERLRAKTGASAKKLDAFERGLRNRLQPAIETAVGRVFCGGLRVV